MTVNELVNAGFEAITLPEPERELSGVYIGDLLSWVRGRAQAGNAWITIMSNVNVAAVASLADVGCVILAEDVSADKELSDAAESRGINLLKSKSAAYETAVKLSLLGI